MNRTSDFPEIAKTTLGLVCRRDVPGSRVTTFCIGGPLEYWFEVQHDSELAGLIALAQINGEPYRVIGRGSNLLIADEGVSGITIKLGERFSLMREIGRETETNVGDLLRADQLPRMRRFRVGAAAYLPKISKELSEAGLSGLEFAGGIPGTVGGAICMNAGAHGAEMADVVDKVFLVTAKGDVVQLAYRDLKPSYRHGGLPEGSIVTAVELCLREGDISLIRQHRESCLESRRKAQPLHLPSAGSVFRNPSVELTAGYLLEACGLKGASEGGAMISEMHANWIVNSGKRASAADVKRLIERCKEAVSRVAEGAVGVGGRSIDLIQEIKEWR